MAKRKGSVLGIIAFIFSILGLGLGGYALYSTWGITNQTVVPEAHLARVYLTSSYSITDFNYHVVNFNAIDYNVGNNFDLTTDTFTCTYAGYYLISGMVTLNYLDDGEYMYVAIYRNTTILEAGNSVHASLSSVTSAEIVDTLYLNIGDLIQLKVLHSHTPETNIFGLPSATWTYLSIGLIQN